MKTNAENRRRGESEKKQSAISGSSPRLRNSASPRSPLRSPIRILTAVPICDGHDSAISTVNIELIRGGIEVIYLGFHRSVRDIVRAAIQEDVRAVGLSSYNGGHVEFFTEVVAQLRAAGASDIGVFGGGGGTISAADAKAMHRAGVDRIFFAGTPLDEVVRFAHDHYGKPSAASFPRRTKTDRDIAKALTLVEQTPKAQRTRSLGSSSRNGARSPLVIGITGPGGAGKTTLIDELVLRFLSSNPTTRIAILSHDPSLADNGALLGDRAAMIHAQHDRVFMRSLATRGQAGGLSPGTLRCLRLLIDVAMFDVILIETVGIGQEATPFAANPGEGQLGATGRGTPRPVPSAAPKDTGLRVHRPVAPGAAGLVDRTVFVMGADYGSRLQLQKIAMLDTADVVVVNKSDLAGARTAASEIAQRLESNPRPARVIPTTAKRHRDPGVDELWTACLEARHVNEGNAIPRDPR